MSEILNYKTRAEIKEIAMPKVLGNNQYKRKYVIGIDGGYSSVKTISENSIGCSPSFAKKVEDVDVIGRLRPTDMILEDHLTGEMWLIGSFAEKAMDNKDIQALTDNSLYTRYRYKSDIYKAIMTAGHGVGLFKADAKPEEMSICLQTGLPSAYVKSDAKILKETLMGNYDFSLRIGNEIKRFCFELPFDNIGVMEQPRGTLANIVYDKNGRVIHKNKEILNSDAIVLDIGFGTEDIFSLLNSSNIKGDNRIKTYSDTAMKSVFEECINEVNSQYDSVYKVFELQKFLSRGTIPVLNPENPEGGLEEIEFVHLLDKYNKELCEKSVHRLLEEYDHLINYKYLIVTGGTGESRFEQISDIIAKRNPKVTVLRGNCSDLDIPAIYANVRGYYMSMLLKIQKNNKKEA